jgi:serine/threonine protein kinase
MREVIFDTKKVYIVMDYLESGSLSAFLKQQKKVMAETQIAKLMI